MKYLILIIPVLCTLLEESLTFPLSGANYQRIVKGLNGKVRRVQRNLPTFALVPVQSLGGNGLDFTRQERSELAGIPVGKKYYLSFSSGGDGGSYRRYRTALPLPIVSIPVPISENLGVSSLPDSNLNSKVEAVVAPEVVKNDSKSEEEGQKLARNENQPGQGRILSWLFGRPSYSPYARPDYSILETVGGITRYPHGPRVPGGVGYTGGIGGFGGGIGPGSYVVEECTEMLDPISGEIVEDCYEMPAVY